MDFSSVAHSGELFRKDEVERIGDLQRFLVTVDGDNVDAEAFDQPRVVRRQRSAQPVGQGRRARTIGWASVIGRDSAVGQASPVGCELAMGPPEHLGTESLRWLDSSQLGPLEVAPHHCTRARALSHCRNWIVWSIRGGFSAKIAVDRPDNSVRSAPRARACARFRTAGPVRNDPPNGIDHRQNRNDRLGAGLQRGDHSGEHLGRGQTPCRIMNENELRTSVKFQGCLHRRTAIIATCYGCN
ncbi:hypothetical protein BI49514_00344 [Brevibacterium iodinum ATCC 49514]|uniref:Uncharacterized protein n=1 Tax=Brevibacterium iodinum ATCC 49514 TaxID=1255616 RepID=A0A2H1HVF1_9MICO|nr:hypothetical protein BI49514_00344 [Brevibacterium iodinum ATCC 49514]SUW13628.1 Uncharacterised protein [Brevibacterium iodinum]